MTHDYSPLGTAHDLPGDPDAIRRLARRYADTADEIVAAASRLERLGTGTEGVWKGHAGRSFPEKARDLAGRIRKAEARYRRTGEALARFGDQAELAQDHAARAAHRARQATADLAATAPLAAPPGPPTPAQTAAAQSRADAHDAARARLHAARNDFADARHDYERAATATHDAIREASHDDGLRDSWWYRHWHAIVTALVVIAIVVLVVAVVCLVIACPAVLGLLGALGLSEGAVAGVAVAATGLSTAAELVGAALAVSILALDVQGKLAGHDVSAKTLALDTLAVATFGLARFVLVPRVSRLATEVENAAKVSRGTEAAFESMAEFDTVVDRAPTLLDYLIVDSLRPLAVERAVARGEAAVEELERTLRLAAVEGDSPALRLILRENPEELTRLAKLAELDPAFADALARGVGMSVGKGLLQSGTDLAVTGYALDQIHAEHATGEHTEVRAEAIAEEVRRYVLSTP